MLSELAVNIKEAAAALGLSPHTVRLWIRQGRLPHVRLGRRVMVEPQQLKWLVKEGRR